ncbi:MAG TPA: PilC/PilY family type IV pilus protein, partial [Syntrophales bacterium]
MRRHILGWMSVIAGILISCGSALAVDYSDQALFSAVSPDAMIVLDLSGSMRWNPRGEYDSSQEPLRRFGNDTCSGDAFYDTPRQGFTTDCARYLIAKRAIYQILDDNKDGVIDKKDEAGLNIRLGFWKFSTNDKKHRDLGQPYAAIWCGNDTCSGADFSLYSGEDTILYWTDSLREKQRVYGSTGLASCMVAVNTYMEGNKKEDPYRKCRYKFVILVTDGQDTLYCGGTGSGNQVDQYKRRRAAVAKVKTLRDAGYKVFVIGLGDKMPEYLKYTLNWMAYHGGTENPLVSDKKGNPSALNIGAIEANPCASSATTSPIAGGCSGNSDQCFATTNDPGTLELSGYAFISTNAKELETALRMAMTYIRDATYSFSALSVSPLRVTDENYTFMASFQPGNTDPFWKGSIERYKVVGKQVSGPADKDAGAALLGMNAADRKILTAKGGSVVAFTTANLSAADLGGGDTARRDEIVGYIRGEATYNPEKDATGNVWKLGDIFHSNLVIVGTPTSFFIDGRDGGASFSTYRLNNQRTSLNQRRIIVAGANDGQLHAFGTGDLKEAWSFIPPNVLDRLKDITHKVHPAGLTHQFYVDGPITVADVWTGSGNGKAKTPADWRTMLVVGLGRGGAKNLWSSSHSCDSGFSNVYLTSGDYPHYCGYHGLDITDTLNPKNFLNPGASWRIRPTAAQAPFLGDPWSRMVIRRVRNGMDEKWVGIIGGGHNASSCTGAADCDARGKGVFVVDLATGNILWSVNRYSPGASGMNFALPSMAAVIDTDADGFADRAYIGDLGGNILRLNFCRQSDGDGCTWANWKVSLFFQGDGNTGPVYFAPAVTTDEFGNYWVYWGTGDRLEPVAVKGYKDRIYGVRDFGKTTAMKRDDLQDISNAGLTFTKADTKDGWYIELNGKGEKVLDGVSLVSRVLSFTAYTPDSGGSDPCDTAGSSTLYSVSYVSGAGCLTGG